MENKTEHPRVDDWAHSEKAMKSHRGFCLAANDIDQQKQCAGYPEGSKGDCPHLAYDYLHCGMDRRQC